MAQLTWIGIFTNPKERKLTKEKIMKNIPLTEDLIYVASPVTVTENNLYIVVESILSKVIIGREHDFELYISEHIGNLFVAQNIIYDTDFMKKFVFDGESGSVFIDNDLPDSEMYLLNRRSDKVYAIYTLRTND